MANICSLSESSKHLKTEMLRTTVLKHFTKLTVSGEIYAWILKLISTIMMCGIIKGRFSVNVDPDKQAVRSQLFCCVSSTQSGDWVESCLLVR